MSLRSAVCLLVLLWVGGCAGPATDAPAARATGDESGPPIVYVVNYPLQYLTQRIAGELADVRFPAPPDVDPAFWSPSAEVIVAYQSADVILLNGAGYARWIRHATLPEGVQVDTTGKLAGRLIVEDSAVQHNHGPEGDHSHGELAFTTWLDPEVAIEQARAVRNALVALRPDQAAEFDLGLGRTEDDLEALGLELQQIFDEAGRPALLASHPVYSYLARRYDLTLRSVHFEPDAEPDAAAWDELAGHQAELAARWMLWEAPPLPQTSARLAQLNIVPVVFRPCGNAPSSGDYLSAMQENVENLRLALREE